MELCLIIQTTFNLNRCFAEYIIMDIFLSLMGFFSNGPFQGLQLRRGINQHELEHRFYADFFKDFGSIHQGSIFPPLNGNFIQIESRIATFTQRLSPADVVLQHRDSINDSNLYLY